MMRDSATPVVINMAQMINVIMRGTHPTSLNGVEKKKQSKNTAVAHRAKYAPMPMLFFPL